MAEVTNSSASLKESRVQNTRLAPPSGTDSQVRSMEGVTHDDGLPTPALSPDNTNPMLFDTERENRRNNSFSAHEYAPHHRTAKEEEPRKRTQVKRACVNCQKACKKCDNGRPCGRCIKFGLESTCADSQRKERQRIGTTKREKYEQHEEPSENIDSSLEALRNMSKLDVLSSLCHTVLLRAKESVLGDVDEEDIPVVVEDEEIAAAKALESIANRSRGVESLPHDTSERLSDDLTATDAKLFEYDHKFFDHSNLVQDAKSGLGNGASGLGQIDFGNLTFEQLAAALGAAVVASGGSVASLLPFLPGMEQFNKPPLSASSASSGRGIRHTTGGAPPSMSVATVDSPTMARPHIHGNGGMKRRISGTMIPSSQHPPSTHYNPSSRTRSSSMVSSTNTSNTTIARDPNPLDELAAISDTVRRMEDEAQARQRKRQNTASSNISSSFTSPSLAGPAASQAYGFGESGRRRSLSSAHVSRTADGSTPEIPKPKDSTASENASPQSQARPGSVANVSEQAAPDPLPSGTTIATSMGLSRTPAAQSAPSETQKPNPPSAVAPPIGVSHALQTNSAHTQLQPSHSETTPRSSAASLSSSITAALITPAPTRKPSPASEKYLAEDIPPIPSKIQGVDRVSNGAGLVPMIAGTSTNVSAAVTGPSSGSQFTSQSASRRGSSDSRGYTTHADMDIIDANASTHLVYGHTVSTAPILSKPSGFGKGRADGGVPLSQPTQLQYAGFTSRQPYPMAPAAEAHNDFANVYQSSYTDFLNDFAPTLSTSGDGISMLNSSHNASQSGTGRSTGSSRYTAPMGEPSTRKKSQQSVATGYGSNLTPGTDSLRHFSNASLQQPSSLPSFSMAMAGSLPPIPTSMNLSMDIRMPMSMPMALPMTAPMMSTPSGVGSGMPMGMGGMPMYMQTQYPLHYAPEQVRERRPSASSSTSGSNIHRTMPSQQQQQQQAQQMHPMFAQPTSTELYLPGSLNVDPTGLGFSGAIHGDEASGAGIGRRASGGGPPRRTH